MAKDQGKWSQETPPDKEAGQEVFPRCKLRTDQPLLGERPKQTDLRMNDMHCDPPRYPVNPDIDLAAQTLPMFQTFWTMFGSSSHWIRDSDSGGTLGIPLSGAELANNLHYSLI